MSVGVGIAGECTRSRQLFKILLHTIIMRKIMNEKVIMENIGAIRGYQDKITKCLNRMWSELFKEGKK